MGAHLHELLLGYTTAALRPVSNNNFLNTSPLKTLIRQYPYVDISPADMPIKSWLGDFQNKYLTFSPDKKWVVAQTTIENPSELALVDLSSGVSSQEIFSLEGEDFLSFGFTSTGGFIICSRVERSIIVWNADSHMARKERRKQVQNFRKVHGNNEKDRLAQRTVRFAQDYRVIEFANRRKEHDRPQIYDK